MKIVIIQKKLLVDLKRCVEEYNKETRYKLKLDVAVYIVSLINILPTYFRDQSEEITPVSLDSQRLKKINHNYAKYIAFLIKNGFIVKINNYGVDVSKCNGYIISDNYYADELESFKIADNTLLKRFDVRGRDQWQRSKMVYCEKDRPHLVACFNEHLIINAAEAYKECKLYLENNEPRQYVRSLHQIMEWYQQSWTYSTNPATDNRLHTLLTRTDRTLRKHIRCSGERLVALDIKTSQPFFLCAILKAVYRKDYKQLVRIGATKVLGKSLVKELFELDIDREEIHEFGKIVIRGDLYEALQEIIPINKFEGRPYRTVWQKKQWPNYRTKIFYETERELIKKVVLEIFNGSHRANTVEAIAFRNAFPSVYKIMAFIKENKIEFYRLLSCVEAYCLLDYAAKLIGKKNPDLPLFSIHDSLVTTNSNVATLKKEMLFHLEKVTGLTPTIKEEDWLQQEVLTTSKEIK